jgi:hypothetical protein
VGSDAMDLTINKRAYARGTDAAKHLRYAPGIYAACAHPVDRSRREAAGAGERPHGRSQVSSVRPCAI